jgi:hypothetical protein
VTEFGAEGNRENPDDRHGGLGFQADLLRTHIRTYAGIPWLSGMLAWNLRDFAVAPSFGGGSIVEKVEDIKLVRASTRRACTCTTGAPSRGAGHLPRIRSPAALTAGAFALERTTVRAGLAAWQAIPRSGDVHPSSFPIRPSRARRSL